jgi:hypothetical protein
VKKAMFPSTRNWCVGQNAKILYERALKKSDALVGRVNTFIILHTK